MEKILVVDDKKRIRNIYRKLLTAEGFSVIEASNADQANEIVKRERIDLMLLDIKLPEVKGDVLFEITQCFHKQIKIIVASVYPLDEQKCIIEGASDYYDKSQGVEILLRKIKDILHN